MHWSWPDQPGATLPILQPSARNPDPGTQSQQHSEAHSIATSALPSSQIGETERIAEDLQLQPQNQRQLQQQQNQRQKQFAVGSWSGQPVLASPFSQSALAEVHASPPASPPGSLASPSCCLHPPPFHLSTSYSPLVQLPAGASRVSSTASAISTAGSVAASLHCDTALRPLPPAPPQPRWSTAPPSVGPNQQQQQKQQPALQASALSPPQQQTRNVLAAAAALGATQGAPASPPPAQQEAQQQLQLLQLSAARRSLDGASAGRTLHLPPSHLYYTPQHAAPQQLPAQPPQLPPGAEAYLRVWLDASSRATSSAFSCCGSADGSALPTSTSTLTAHSLGASPAGASLAGEPAGSLISSTGPGAATGAYPKAVQLPVVDSVVLSRPEGRRQSASGVLYSSSAQVAEAPPAAVAPRSPYGEWQQQQQQAREQLQERALYGRSSYPPHQQTAPTPWQSEAHSPYHAVQQQQQAHQEHQRVLQGLGEALATAAAAQFTPDQRYALPVQYTAPQRGLVNSSSGSKSIGSSGAGASSTMQQLQQIQKQLEAQQLMVNAAIAQAAAAEAASKAGPMSTSSGSSLSASSLVSGAHASMQQQQQMLMQHAAAAGFTPAQTQAVLQAQAALTAAGGGGSSNGNRWQAAALAPAGPTSDQEAAALASLAAAQDAQLLSNAFHQQQSAATAALLGSLLGGGTAEQSADAQAAAAMAAAAALGSPPGTALTAEQLAAAAVLGGDPAAVTPSSVAAAADMLAAMSVSLAHQQRAQQEQQQQLRHQMVHQQQQLWQQQHDQQQQMHASASMLGAAATPAEAEAAAAGAQLAAAAATDSGAAAAALAAQLGLPAGSPPAAATAWLAQQQALQQQQSQLAAMMSTSHSSAGSLGGPAVAGALAPASTATVRTVPSFGSRSRGGSGPNSGASSIGSATLPAAGSYASSAAPSAGGGGMSLSGGPRSGGGGGGPPSGGTGSSTVSVTQANLVIPASGSMPQQMVAVTVSTTSDGLQSVTLPASALTHIMPRTPAAADPPVPAEWLLGTPLPSLAVSEGTSAAVSSAPESVLEAVAAREPGAAVEEASSDAGGVHVGQVVASEPEAASHDAAGEQPAGEKGEQQEHHEASAATAAAAHSTQVSAGTGAAPAPGAVGEDGTAAHAPIPAAYLLQPAPAVDAPTPFSIPFPPVPIAAPAAAPAPLPTIPAVKVIDTAVPAPPAAALLATLPAATTSPPVAVVPSAAALPPPLAAAASPALSPTPSALAAANAAAAALGLTPPPPTALATATAAALNGGAAAPGAAVPSVILPLGTGIAPTVQGVAAPLAAGAVTPALAAAPLGLGGVGGGTGGPAVTLDQALLASKVAAETLSRTSASSISSVASTPSTLTAASLQQQQQQQAAAAAADLLASLAATSGASNPTIAAAASEAAKSAYATALLNAAVATGGLKTSPPPSSAASTVAAASPAVPTVLAVPTATAASGGTAPLTLQSLQGTLASASLARSLLQPGAAVASRAAGGGAFGGPLTSASTSVGSGWSLPTAPTAAMATLAANAAAAAAAQQAAASAMTAPAAIGGIASLQAKDNRVKVLLYAGGAFSRCPSGMWEYTGGEARLVAVPRAASIVMLTDAVRRAAAQQAEAAAAAAGEAAPPPSPLVLKYELPGAPELLVDLLCDDDVGNMWEALEEYCRADAKPTFKLKLLLATAAAMGSGSGRRQTGSGSGTAPAPGGGASASGGTGDATGPADTHSPSGSQSYATTPEHGSTGSITSPPPGVLTAARQTQPAAGPQDAGAPGMMRTSYDSTAATEREAEQALLRSELGDLVTRDPRVGLSELESKLELIRPEDLAIMRFLGSGGYGEVYLCRWHSCDVAVKCLNPSLLASDAGGSSTISSDVVTELLREAAMLGGLRHPNIVWVYGVVLPGGVRELKAKRDRLDDVGDIDAVRLTTALAAGIPVLPGVIRPPALVTEYLSAGSLRTALSRGADFLRSDVVRVKLALDAARGMEYLHLKRIVHFDLKTGNLLVGFREKSPTCKVADFGLSKQRQQTYVTGVTSLRGTLPWTAPEIIRTPKAVTDKADVYSFGVVMWELWTFREPFDGLNYHALLHQISMATDPVRPSMPGSADWEGPTPEEPGPGWVELMCRCWDEQPDARPTFSRVVSELEAMLATVRSRRRAATAAM